MSIALPITQPEDPPHNDPRHYTNWSQVKAPQVITASPVNPIPEDVGTPNKPTHYTGWQPKPLP